jgi:Protein of unknown function (DUF4013)
MDYAEILSDAYAYTKEGVINNTNRWMKLILAVLCLGLPFNGYTMRIYRGEKPAPDIDRWGTLFIDGLKLFVVALVYIIPLVILMLLVFAVVLLAIASGDPEEPGMLIEALESLFMILLNGVELIVAAFLPVAYIRLSRTGVFFEAFNLSAIAETIGKIGWINYIIAVVLVAIVIGVPLLILICGYLLVFFAALFLFSKNLIVMIVLLAALIVLLLFIIPVVNVFHARYLARVYDSAEIPA